MRTLFYIEAREQSQVYDAWMRGYITQLAKNPKQFPKDPKHLPFWPKPRDENDAIEDAFDRMQILAGG